MIEILVKIKVVTQPDQPQAMVMTIEANGLATPPETDMADLVMKHLTLADDEWKQKYHAVLDVEKSIRQQLSIQREIKPPDSTPPSP